MSENQTREETIYECIGNHPGTSGLSYIIKHVLRHPDYGPKGYVNSHVKVDFFPMNCCGLGQLYSISDAKYFAKNPDKFFQLLAKCMFEQSSYRPWQFQFIIPQGYHSYEWVRMMIAHGAKEVDKYGSESMPGHVLSVYRFNLKEMIGKYIDEKGQPLPKEAPVAAA